MHPTPNRLLLPIQALGNFGARFAIHQEQNTMVSLAQPDIMRPAKGGPHLLAGDGSVGDRQHRQALLHGVFSSGIPPGLENWVSFLGLL
jgi:hypothetical protein